MRQISEAKSFSEPSASYIDPKVETKTGKGC